jgi:hypothetical protein
MTEILIGIPPARRVREVLPLSKELWLFLLKNALTIDEKRLTQCRRGKYCVHHSESHVLVVLYSLVNHCSIGHASEELNAIAITCNPASYPLFKDGRQRRAVPHQTDVNAFLRKVGPKRVTRLLQGCFDALLREVLGRGLLKGRVAVVFDTTEHAYYGQRDDAAICGTVRQKGTKKMRHFLKWSIVAKNFHVTIGTCLLRKGASKIPLIEAALEHLLALGIPAAEVIWDREFYRAELFDAVKGAGLQLLMPAKKYARINQMLEEYLLGRAGRVRKYRFSTAHNNKLRVTTGAWLLVGAKKGQNLGAVRRAFQAGRTTLSAARDNLYAFLLAKRPGANDVKRVSARYKKRWVKETKFCDENSLAPRWRTNVDHSRLIGETARALVQGAWQVVAAERRERDQSAQSPTIRHVLDALKYAIWEYITSQTAQRGIHRT